MSVLRLKTISPIRDFGDDRNEKPPGLRQEEALREERWNDAIGVDNERSEG